MTSSLPAAQHEFLSWSATRIADEVGSKNVSALEVVRCFIDRIAEVDQQINATCYQRFDAALVEAKRADELLAAGDRLGSLHGVPVTLKESYYLTGSPSTIGLTAWKTKLATRDGVIARSLRDAGAIFTAKTNVPLLMFSMESTNPLHGTTLNPWNHNRTPGGSTGGEAALIAARGSVLGIGGDLGGSIRVPCHFCGIHGIKPTNRRITRQGSVDNLRGMKAMEFQPGPMSRNVEDLSLALNVLCQQPNATDVAVSQIRDFRKIDVSKLRLGLFSGSQLFPVSLAISRVLQEAAECLRNAGADVVEFVPPRFEEVVDRYVGIMGADGGKNLRDLTRGSSINPSMQKMFRIGRIPRWLRPAIGGVLGVVGQTQNARLLRATGNRSVAEYWQLSGFRDEYEVEFSELIEEQALDGILMPPFALPAVLHDTSVDLLLAGCYAFFANYVGLPAGVVSLSRVRSDETAAREKSKDASIRVAIRNDEGSAGLPVGVQVLARHWREDVVLAIMAELETQFQHRTDYPPLVPNPA